MTALLPLVWMLHLAACNGSDPEEPPQASLGESCSGALCADLHSAFYTSQPCDGAPEETCSYANVYFLLRLGEENVGDLTSEGLSMTIADREVGVEGAEALSQENGLLVDLLLDRSYSITEAGATDAVRDAAIGFVSTLPDEAYARVSMFASEAVLPAYLAPNGAPTVEPTLYLRVGENASALEDMIRQDYGPYEAATSDSFTKLYDAVGYLANVTPDEDLQLLQRVIVVFTDGSDTASTGYGSAAAVASEIAAAERGPKVYAIGLGDGIDEPALRTISDDRSYLAASNEELEVAFEEVNSDLRAIYHYRILVAQMETGVTGTLDITYGGESLSVQFPMDAIGEAGDGLPTPTETETTTTDTASGDAVTDLMLAETTCALFLLCEDFFQDEAECLDHFESYYDFSLTGDVCEPNTWSDWCMQDGPPTTCDDDRLQECFQALGICELG